MLKFRQCDMLLDRYFCSLTPIISNWAFSVSKALCMFELSPELLSEDIHYVCVSATVPRGLPRVSAGFSTQKIATLDTDRGIRGSKAAPWKKLWAIWLMAS